MSGYLHISWRNSRGKAQYVRILITGHYETSTVSLFSLEVCAVLLHLPTSSPLKHETYIYNVLDILQLCHCAIVKTIMG